MENVSIIDSVCTYCGVGCDISASVKDNTILSISAHPEGVVSQGNLCVKGKYGYEFVTAPDRLKNPRIRKSFLEKNPAIKEALSLHVKALDDTWVETTLDAATTAASMKLREIQQTYGKKSICSISGARK